MRLLLINAVNTDSISETVFPNLGLGYIASYLSKFIKNIEIKIVNSNGKNISGLLKLFSPDLIGVSSVSQNFNYVNSISNECNRLGIPVFIGGIHISSLPQSLPEGCDVGVIGEGEDTVVDLINSFTQHGFEKHTLHNIEGIVFRDDSGQIIMTPERKLIDNLDELPFPNRDLLGVKKNSFLHLFSSRGCRYRCIFCSNSRFWKKIRLFSAEYVFDELKEVMAKYHPKAITFYDDDFLTSKDRLNRLVLMIENSGMNKETEFNLMARVDSIDEEIVLLLKKMNVTVVSLGIESGSQKTLDFLKCGTSSVQKNMEAVELLHKTGIFTYGFFIIGAPNETEEDVLETLDFINKSPLTGFSIYTLVPYPGTPIWDYAKERRLVSDSMPWSRLALNINESKDDIIILSEKISRKRLYQLYWRFQKLRKRRHFVLMIKRAWNNPALIMPRLARSASHYLGCQNVNQL
jgi:radical SAM superfamily enzyme YgiQ (UPF0313 family)